MQLWILENRKVVPQELHPEGTRFSPNARAEPAEASVQGDGLSAYNSDSQHPTPDPHDDRETLNVEIDCVDDVKYWHIEMRCANGCRFTTNDPQ